MAQSRREVIHGVLTHLNASYVFPEKAKEMEAAVREREQRKEYEPITSAQELARVLTEHLRAVSHDKHLSVFFSPQPLPSNPPDAKPSPEMRRQMAAMLRHLNYGFEKVERLEGNVGYVELRGFAPADSEGAEKAVAAVMEFLSGTDALLIDLRRNSGGEPSMVRLLSSYLFAPKPVHLNTLYYRPGSQTKEFRTFRKLKGTRYGPDRPVYVLTSDQTFSAAEEFSYNLKQLKRATIVGETTGGGAHDGRVERITEHFGMYVPTGRAINPITKTNWEGIGVEPDVKVNDEAALGAAHLAALQAVRARATAPRPQAALDQIIRTLTAKK